MTVYPPLDRLLAPRDTEVGLLVRPADVGGAGAYQELLRRGSLVAVRDGVAAPARVPVTPTLRALAVRDDVPPSCVVAGASAAWVLCGGPPPPRLEVVYPPGAHRPAPRHGRVPRQAALLASETELVAGVRVTDPRRTALDVASRCDADHAATLLGRLRDARGLDLAAVSRALELRYRWAGRDRARIVLARLLAAEGHPG
ncbi:hypothetical protein [Cellulosimicrobium sp. CUA-896]|uniref:hypothetical protein n=1 Tax=Cellulosimicrobium sp. CUA-896 TaxID=1517881 RepID=UPI00095ECBED|nr:hypothetical protein [Cellulosimicrobium sp. CUA-896]OLT53043.1 hypothetical protein BJF88_01165 [Cellulosimicrobium sp. CUA-896]